MSEDVMPDADVEFLKRLEDVEHLMPSFTPLMVDRSLAQTRKAGMGYASVPEPVFVEWANWCGENASMLSWRTTCITKVESADDATVTVTQDGDGNVLLCLLDRGHKGDCGYAHLIS